jgi:hypothetical protein
MRFLAAALVATISVVRQTLSPLKWRLSKLPLVTCPIITMPCLPYVPDFSAGDISWLLPGDHCAEAKKSETEQPNNSTVIQVNSRTRSHQT